MCIDVLLCTIVLVTFNLVGGRPKTNRQTVLSDGLHVAACLDLIIGSFFAHGVILSKTKRLDNT